METKFFKLLTLLAVRPRIRPRVLANALETVPQFFTPGAVLARIGITFGFALFYDVAQMNAHVRVDVQNFSVHHQTTETSHQSWILGALHD